MNFDRYAAQLAMLIPQFNTLAWMEGLKMAFNGHPFYSGKYENMTEDQIGQLWVQHAKDENLSILSPFPLIVEHP